jgi:YD repeat-containing protein
VHRFFVLSISAYDAINRITQVQRPTSATNPTLLTATYVYSGNTIATMDFLSKQTTKTYLPTGSLGISKDALGYYQAFGYDSFGSLLNVTDSAGNQLFTATYDYGIQAFQRNATDIDSDLSTQAGQHRQYVYDALGEITSWKDAKGQSFSMLYDLLSRPTTRTEPDLATTWTWGSTATSYNIGQLQAVSAVGSAGTYTTNFSYDTKTRLSTETLALPGDATYTYTATYNATTGLLDTFQYPVSTSSYQLKLQYAYANGILKSVADFNAPTTEFWTANAMNPRGQVTQETLGNGVITNRSYDAVTGWVNTIQSGIGGGSGRLNASFAFDGMGNVSQRQDNNLGLSENFFYDSDYRLDHSTLNGAINLQMAYDTTGMGNIASRSDVASGAAWTYDPVRKHAVTKAGSSSNSYTYDNNGNATSRNGSTIAWTSYNYPTSIASAGESVDFFYGPDRQRWKTIYSGSIGTETTYHVDTLLEKVVNGGVLDYRHYIYANGEPVAVYSRTSSGTNTLRYLLEDDQGSVASILTSTGSIDVNESFTAFGNRRSAETWSGAPTSSDETTINGVSRHGYTDQTALGVSMGLNHLNGRVEDAVTGASYRQILTCRTPVTHKVLIDTATSTTTR